MSNISFSDSSSQLKQRFYQKNIQGKNWGKHNLKGANFVKAHAGLTSTRMFFLCVQLLGVSVFAGILSALAAIWATALLGTPNLEKFTAIPGIAAIAFTLVSLALTTHRGFSASLGLSTIVLCSSALFFLFIHTDSQKELWGNIFVFIAFSTINQSAALWLGTAVSVADRSLTRSISSILAIAALLGLTSVFLLVAQLNSVVRPDWLDGFVAICVMLTSLLMGQKAVKPYSQFSGITQIAIHLTAMGGTSFKEANLTEANFSQSILKYTDFRDANLTRTYWRDAKGLEFARLGKTYLANPKIRQLVITCDGQGQKFDGLDLTGVNLQDANLQDSSFVGANLNQSNLRGADLSRAVLKQTQLDEADLSGAILTGACIEDWGITGTTKLKNVQCDYVFMRVETPDNPNRLRKPDNWRETFAEGEFADFIQPFFNTLDLYHSQDVDPRAISIALKKLADDHPDDDLQFVAIERRGNNGINLRFTTAPNANKSDLSHEYFANYTQIKKELPVSVQIRLAEQDAEIRTLKGTIEQFIQTGTHQSTIHAENIQVIQGEIVVTENRGINIQAGDNANISGLSSGDGVVNLGTISGNVTNAINQLPESPEPDQPSLKALLTQLQQAIEADTDLSDPDKSDLLEQVQALAEAKQTEEPAKREGLVRKAIKMFDATLNSLPDTARIVDACSKLLPVILKTLGLPI